MLAKHVNAMLNFLASEFEPGDSTSAKVHVIPVPYERTVSYGGGTSCGPAAILRASQQLEAYLEGVGCPGKAGIHTTVPVDVRGKTDVVLDRIGQAVGPAIDTGAVPMILGGEHTVTYGAVGALAARIKGTSATPGFGIVQFDAHADLRSRYGGTEWSHACVMRRIVEDFSPPVFQIGVRSICEEEIEARQEFNVRAMDASRIAAGDLPDVLVPADFPENIYITFDVDALDASLMPATGTPEPGGLDWWQTVTFLKKVCYGRKIAGCDMVELAPISSFHHCEFTAAKLTYLMMGLALQGGTTVQDRQHRH